VGLRIAFGGAMGSHLLVELPELPLPDWMTGVRIGGPVMADSVLAALYDGLRLATIVICFGAANSLANPKRLLRVLPAALYEAGTAVTVAMSVAPQLAESLVRVGRARRLRGGASGRRRRSTILVPVLEDALERSILLAAAMDARGYGRRAGRPRRMHRLTGALLVSGLGGLAIGLYGLLDATVPLPLAAPILLAGVGLVMAGFVTAGRRAIRTRYRPDPWARPEWLLAGAAAAAVGLATIGAAVDPAALHPSLVPLAWPELAVLPTIAVLVAGLPTWLLPAWPVAPATDGPGPRSGTIDGLAPRAVR
jgi:energy-coupling factor transport system permease protein